MPSFSGVAVRQPQPPDLVDDPVAVSGVRTGFEGTVGARVRDGNGAELARVSIQAGGMGVWGNFRAEIPLGAVPATAHGTLEVFGESGRAGADTAAEVVVPIVFARALVDPYHDFYQHTVDAGDTLRTIAKRWYQDPEAWTRIFEANRDQIGDPNTISPGQVLCVPQ